MNLEKFVERITDTPNHVPDSLKFIEIFGGFEREQQVCKRIYDDIRQALSKHDRIEGFDPDFFEEEDPDFLDTMASLIGNLKSYMESMKAPKNFTNLDDYFIGGEVDGQLHEIALKIGKSKDDYAPSVIKVVIESGIKVCDEYLSDDYLEGIKEKIAQNPLRVDTGFLANVLKVISAKSHEGLLKDITREKDDIWPILSGIANIVDTTFYDISTFYLGDFQDSKIKTLYKKFFNEKRDKFNYIYEGLYTKLASGFVDTDGLNLIINAGKQLLAVETRKPLRERQALRAIAYSVYGSNLRVMPLLEKRDMDHSFEIGGALNILKEKEFHDFYQTKDFGEYIDRIENKRDINIVVEGVKRLIDSDSLSDYMSLFLEKENRSSANIKRLTSKRFLDVWEHAEEKKWLDTLISNLSSMNKVYNTKVANILQNQKSDDLISLIGNDEFVKYFRKNSNDMDFKSLNEILQNDEGLFNIIMSRKFFEEQYFITSLSRLVTTKGYEAGNITLDHDIKEYITGLEEYSSKELPGIMSVIANFSKISRIRKLKLCPEFEDDIDFAVWFGKNHENAVQDLENFELANTYMFGSASKKLRGDLIRIIGKQGKKFCDSYLPSFHNQGTLVYQRLCKLLADIDKPRDICRKREIKNGIIAMASDVNEEEWNSLRSDLMAAKKDYQDVFVKYRIRDRARGKKMADLVDGDNDTINAYLRAKQTGQEYLIDRLNDVSDQMDATVFEGVCHYIANDQTKLATLVITEIENGLANGKARDIVEFYQQDTDLEHVSLAEVIGTSEEVQITEVPNAAEEVHEVTINIDERRRKKFTPLHEEMLDLALEDIGQYRQKAKVIKRQGAGRWTYKRLCSRFPEFESFYKTDLANYYRLFYARHENSIAILDVMNHEEYNEFCRSKK